MNRQLIGIPSEIEDFANLYLVEAELASSLATWRRLAAKINAAQLKKDIYRPVALLLNDISKIVYSRLGPSSVSHPALVFAPWPDGGPSRDAFETKLKPDIHAYFAAFDHLDFVYKVLSDETKDLKECQKSLGDPQPWSNLVAGLELKHKKGGDVQVAHYARTVLRYRPDKPNVLTLLANRKNFRIVHADANGERSSKSYSWDDANAQILFQFAATMYSASRDETMCHLACPQSTHPQWEITHNRRAYQVYHVFARKGTGRRTSIFLGQRLKDPAEAGGDDYVFIKEMWRDTARRYDEGKILQKIHRDGFVPGVVRIEDYTVLSSTVTDASSERIRTRQKTRLFMRSSGSPLSSCNSVVHFLKVMYDAVEAHHHLLDKGVLHRDLSGFNLFCFPRHYPASSSKVDLKRPCIGSLLGEAEPKPYCLIFDFDNAQDLDDQSEVEATERTGTPMFIATEVSASLEAYTWKQETVPRWDSERFGLEGSLKDKYLSIYGVDNFQKFDQFLRSLSDGTAVRSVYYPEGEDRPPIPHQPYHDVESLFWIIVWFLIRACPVGSEALPSLPYFNNVRELLQHRVGVEIGRPQLLRMTKPLWERILHPQLANLASMLAVMGEYLNQRWADYPEAPPWHAHEAFRRILYKTISQLSKDEGGVPVGQPRPLANSTLQETIMVSSSGPMTNNTQQVKEDASISQPSKKRSFAEVEPTMVQPTSSKKVKISEADASDVQLWVEQFSKDRDWFKPPGQRGK